MIISWRIRHRISRQIEPLPDSALVSIDHFWNWVEIHDHRRKIEDILKAHFANLPTTANPAFKLISRDTQKERKVLTYQYQKNIYIVSYFLIPELYPQVRETLLELKEIIEEVKPQFVLRSRHEIETLIKSKITWVSAPDSHRLRELNPDSGKTIFIPIKPKIQSPIIEKVEPLQPRFLDNPIQTPLEEKNNDTHLQTFEEFDRILSQDSKKEEVKPIIISTPKIIPTRISKLDKKSKHEETDSEIEVVEEKPDLDLDDVSSDGKSEAPKILNQILKEALETSASDVHIIPRETHTKVCYRIDGDIVKEKMVKKTTHRALIARIKVLSELDITKRQPESGSFSIRYKKKNLRVRVETCLTYLGHKAVLRILKVTQVPSLKETIVYEPAFNIVSQALNLKSGIVLICGPTGSGKSTTLASMVNHMSDTFPEEKIITLEDPVEYTLKGTVCQIEKKNVGNFAEGLRSILRQDPDKILVGELRDIETMDVAFQAANTGHLVLSTMHTSNCFSAISRLTKRGIHKDIIAEYLKLIMHQSLLKKQGSGRIATLEIFPVTKTERRIIDQTDFKIEQLEDSPGEHYISKQEYSRYLLENHDIIEENTEENLFS